jgi:hypothetical protein
MRSEEELRQFIAGELRQHVEAWRQVRRIRPPGWLDLVATTLVALTAIAIWRPEPLGLLVIYAVVRVMRDVRRASSRPHRHDRLRLDLLREPADPLVVSRVDLVALPKQVLPAGVGDAEAVAVVPDGDDRDVLAQAQRGAQVGGRQALDLPAELATGAPDGLVDGFVLEARMRLKGCADDVLDRRRPTGG